MIVLINLCLKQEKIEHSWLNIWVYPKSMYLKFSMGTMIIGFLSL